MKYRKKPVVIEALRFERDNMNEIIAFTNHAAHSFVIDPNSQINTCIVSTLEGQHIATLGDYIIKGVKNEFYPCKPDIFELTYEAVE